MGLNVSATDKDTVKDEYPVSVTKKGPFYQNNTYKDIKIAEKEKKSFGKYFQNDYSPSSIEREIILFFNEKNTDIFVFEEIKTSENEIFYLKSAPLSSIFDNMWFFAYPEVAKATPERVWLLKDKRNTAYEYVIFLQDKSFQFSFNLNGCDIFVKVDYITKERIFGKLIIAKEVTDGSFDTSNLTVNNLKLTFDDFQKIFQYKFPYQFQNDKLIHLTYGHRNHNGQFKYKYHFLNYTLNIEEISYTNLRVKSKSHPRTYHQLTGEVNYIDGKGNINVDVSNKSCTFTYKGCHKNIIHILDNSISILPNYHDFTYKFEGNIDINNLKLSNIQKITSYHYKNRFTISYQDNREILRFDLDETYKIYSENGQLMSNYRGTYFYIDSIQDFCVLLDLPKRKVDFEDGVLKIDSMNFIKHKIEMKGEYLAKDHKKSFGKLLILYDFVNDRIELYIDSFLIIFHERKFLEVLNRFSPDIHFKLQ